MEKKIKYSDDEISTIFNDPLLITKAIQAGINEALLRHKQLGKPICVLEAEQVVWIQPENITIKQ